MMMGVMFVAMKLNLLAAIPTALATAALLVATAFMIIGREVQFPAIFKDRYRNPQTHFRPALPPEARLRRDAWALTLSRHGLLLTIMIVAEGVVLVFDSIIGLQYFVVEFSSIMTVSMLVFLVGLRPFGSKLVAAGLMGQSAPGDLLRAFSSLPTRREAVLRLVFAQAFVATAVAAIFAFSLVGYYAMVKTGEFAIVDEYGKPVLWKLFPLITAMLVVPSAVVCGAVGDKLKGILCFGYAFVIGPLTIVLGTELRGIPGRELIVMAVVLIAALAVGLPPLRHLMGDQSSLRAGTE
jgi:hypothetical protein